MNVQPPHTPPGVYIRHTNILYHGYPLGGCLGHPTPPVPVAASASAASGAAPSARTPPLPAAASASAASGATGFQPPSCPIPAIPRASATPAFLYHGHPLGGCLGHSHSTRACGGLRFGGFWCRSLRAHSALACGSLRFGGLWRRWLPATSFPPFQPFARALTVIVVSNPPPQHPACEADHSGHLSRPFPSAPPPQPTCPFHTCRPPTTPSANSTPHQPCGEGVHLGGSRLGGLSVRGLAPHGSPHARTTRQLHPGHDSRTSDPLRRFHKWPISIRPHYKNQVYHFNVLQRHLRRTRSLALPLLTSFINSMRAHSPHSTPNLLQPTHSHFASGRFGGPRLGGARFGGLRRQADKEDLEICD